MGIEMIGIDHGAAGIDIRTKFSFTKKQTGEFLAYMKSVPGVAGCVLLSTCNRTELWVSTGEDWKEDLYDLLCRVRQVAPERYGGYFTCRTEREAVEHLFRLAGGLESRILGEDQILTQVGEALAFSREHYAADHVLETLFRQAVTVAKRIKTEVTLSPTDTSVVHAAICQLKTDGYSFSGKRCLVIGNGAMGKLAALLLKEEGADVTVTVRQYRSGMVEIPKDCKRIDYGRRGELLKNCDFVLSATLSPNYTLTRELIEHREAKISAGCRMKRDTGGMVLVDLAVPRDIEPAVGELPGVRLYDVDSFRADAQSEEQKTAIRMAGNLINAQMAEFFAWYHCVDEIPLIEQIKAAVAADLVPRLNRELRELSVTDDEREHLRTDIDAATERTMNKMLFGLRDGLPKDAFRDCLDCLKDIYYKSS